MRSGAKFSDCWNYRYYLYRDWNKNGPYVTFCMLNPSTADASKNDPTVERCQRRAIEMGFGGLIVVNLFAYRSTDPQALYRHPEPIGADNDKYIAYACAKSTLVVCGWGKHGSFLNRDQEAIALMKRWTEHPLQALQVNKDGSPKHPLYVGYNVQPKVYK